MERQRFLKGVASINQRFKKKKKKEKRKEKGNKTLKSTSLRTDNINTKAKC